MLYSAYGLRVDSTFALPGSEPVAQERTDLPALDVDLVTPGELAELWHVANARTEWLGMLGDGRTLTIERGEGGDRLFRYGELASFHLDDRMLRLACAPTSVGLDWQRALITKVIPAISVMRGYEALHAAAVETPRGVVAIMGPPGSGKSTLASTLLSRGLSLFTDDVLTLSSMAGNVIAHPGTPHMNLESPPALGRDSDDFGDTLAVLGGERWLSVRSASDRPRPVRMLALLERGSGLRLDIEVLQPNPLALAPYMLGLSDARARQRVRFDLYADLLQSATLVRLTASAHDSPILLAGLIERALADRPESAVTS